MATKDESPTLQHEGSTEEDYANPKKRRKVNHACIYCRRSHMTCDLDRPCQRCIKRSIGHLCHDEPRDSMRAQKAENGYGNGHSEGQIKQEMMQPNVLGPSLDAQQDKQRFIQTVEGQISSGSDLPSTFITPQLPPASSYEAQGGVYGIGTQQITGYADWNTNKQNQFPDMSNFPSFFNAPDINDEYNVLNEFLSSSLLDDGTSFQGESAQSADPQLPLNNVLDANGLPTSSVSQQTQDNLTTPKQLLSTQGVNIPRPKSARPERDEEKFYMTIADPSGNDTPQERMNKLLEAKYNAGIIKPFNYVQGYARLGKYMESHLQYASRQRILRQLDKFRPKFRERMHKLTDMQLMLVEMWFERTLMEYDRVFASMAVPACAWRRTGEIFRGNKAMAELIDVPIDKLRDGKIALHEIIAEKDLVNYWDSFLAIAFDTSQKAMLTTCHLKSPYDQASDKETKCCFSFTIRRDSQHNIPSLIVGNFIPQKSREQN